MSDASRTPPGVEHCAGRFVDGDLWVRAHVVTENADVPPPRFTDCFPSVSVLGELPAINGMDPPIVLDGHAISRERQIQPSDEVAGDVEV